jgi:hypothetical protein
MARYSKSASGDVKGAMERRKAGTLKSGKSGKTVKSKKQAIAIGLSEVRAKGQKGSEQEVHLTPWKLHESNSMFASGACGLISLSLGFGIGL